MARNSDFLYQIDDEEFRHALMLYYTGDMSVLWGKESRLLMDGVYETFSEIPSASEDDAVAFCVCADCCVNEDFIFSSPDFDNLNACPVCNENRFANTTSCDNNEYIDDTCSSRNKLFYFPFLWYIICNIQYDSNHFVNLILSSYETFKNINRSHDYFPLEELKYQRQILKDMQNNYKCKFGDAFCFNKDNNPCVTPRKASRVTPLTRVLLQ